MFRKAVKEAKVLNTLLQVRGLKKPDCVWEEGSLKEIRLDGLVVKAGSYGNVLEVFRETEHEQAERYLLTGALRGLKVEELFKTKREAEDRQRVLTKDWRDEEPQLDILEVLATINADGKAISWIARTLVEAEDIPF